MNETLHAISTQGATGRAKKPSLKVGEKNHAMNLSVSDEDLTARSTEDGVG